MTREPAALTLSAPLRRGLFFLRKPVYSAIDVSPERIIHHTFEDAQANGRDNMTETPELRGAMWEEYFPGPRSTPTSNWLQVLCPERLILLDEPQRTLATHLSPRRKRLILLDRPKIQIASEPEVSKRDIQV